MKWLEVFIGKQTPDRISGLFKALMILQIGLYFIHFFMTFRTWNAKWSWQGEINHWFFQYPETWNKRFQFADSVEGSYRILNLTFTFASFQEWLNVYTVGFLVFDLSKYIIIGFVFWQLSKAMSDTSKFGFQNERAKRSGHSNIETIKKDFKGFTTEGVSRLRLAAFPIMFIPLFDYVSNRIFILYASTQSSYVGFQKYPSALVVRSETGTWVYYLYATLILLGISEIFRYGQQLKEETELTV